MQRQTKSYRLLTLLLAIILLSAASCAGAKEAVTKLAGGLDDAGKIVTHEVDASELNGLSNKLDDMAKDVTNEGSLTPEQQAVLDRSPQHAAALREIAGMFGVADGIRDAITTDAVKLLHGSSLSQWNAQFEAKMGEAATSILKETACSAFANEMNASSTIPSTSIPAAGTTASHSQGDVYAELKNFVTDAGYNISAVQQVLNLQGLSSNIVSTAGRYVGMVKKSMTAFSWSNGGAIQAYLRVCVK
ncbi:hypothetical protein [Pseudarthrobacter sp. YAF2]|uniref:hypothetical protein n=1 Tax=Pseudarthrobacter sp. YAF2 TaxID=3233078 RepID=UPI003F99FFE0